MSMNIVLSNSVYLDIFGGPNFLATVSGYVALATAE